MNYLRIVCGLIALLMTGVSRSADVLTTEQNAVKQLIEKMYSYDPDTFEFGEFSKDGKPFFRNLVPKDGGKHQPTKKCLLLSYFFDLVLIKKREIRFGLDGCDAPTSLYPYLSDQDMPSDTRVEDIPAPYIKTPVVSGDRAKVEVFPAGNKKISNPPNFDLGRNLYFLTKSEKGWRITNVMVHTKWPDLDDGTHHCYFSFAKPPNEEEKREIPKHCR